VLRYHRPHQSILAARTGAAGVEFALLLPALSLLLMGTFDYGALAYQTMQVAAAAHAGADYALRNGWNQTGVQNAVTAATSLAVSATPAPALSKGCISNNALVITTNSTCPSGGASGSYVVVNAQSPFSPLLAWSGLSFPSTITAQAAVRIQ